MRRRKLPECQCVACHKFNSDAPAIYYNLESAVMDSFLRPASAEDKRMLRELKRDFVLGKGCDFCNSNAIRVAFVPQIIKDFLQIEYLCEGCRWMLHRTRQQLYWPICWGSTSDDEIRWFLLEFVLQKLRNEIHKLSPAQIAKERACQEWLDSLSKFEEEIVPDIDITIKRRVQPRRTVIDVESS